MLCRWHINKDVVARCKVHFTNGDKWEEMIADWSPLCYASSVEVFEAQWDKFQTKYQHLPFVTRYLDRTWFKYKEKFVEAWVRDVFHLGCSTTSRAESVHSYLKRFLRSSIGDILTVFQSLHLAIEHQVVELNKMHADDRVKRPTLAAAPMYTQVVYKVSSLALTLVHEYHAYTDQCNSKFRLTMGLPCKHSAQKGIDADAFFTLKVSTRIGGWKSLPLILLQEM